MSVSESPINVISSSNVPVDENEITPVAVSNVTLSGSLVPSTIEYTSHVCDPVEPEIILGVNAGAPTVVVKVVYSKSKLPPDVQPPPPDDASTVITFTVWHITVPSGIS